ncbi:DUF6688 domain-containing protein [Niabella hibiscisoli]|uniref:DUF6688 domain-containing protein n=1 Tax=Niabella hibiscisoli TaxID=1825928 RepID=UPI001F0F0251|nr:DUF6688 family protein [Niabella hibiscisoli]MCH5720094.1 hypothetical protein [Niabella hibiscisoli]
MIFSLVILIIGTLIGLGLLKKRVPAITWGAIAITLLYLFLSFVFAWGMIIHDAPYNQAIDPIDRCYAPFADRHTISLLVYFVLYHVAMILVWIRGRTLPPLTLVLLLIFLFIGCILNVVIIFQVAVHQTGTIDGYKGNDGTAFLLPAPLLSLILGLYLIIRLIREEARTSVERSFKNTFLQHCNQLLAGRYHESVWALLLLLPVWLIITLILILLGQDYNSLVKVFTDTTTWALSQKIHPPPLDHQGHYLCTVAARGNPRLVKPLRIGYRHGKPAIVNRQLLIANAFEEWIQNIAPHTHQHIRCFYDRYGYNLSKK